MEIKNFDQFFTKNPNPMWIVDPQSYAIKKVNQASLNLYGYSREEMLSLTLFDLRPEKEIGKLKSYLSERTEEEFKVKGVWTHQKKSGELLSVRTLTNPISYNGQNYKLEICQDITAEQNFQQRYNMLCEHSLDGVMLTNPNGEIIEANRAACEILGMTEEEIKERGRNGIVVKDKKLERALKKRSETGQFTGELNYKHISGRKIPVELTSSVFTNHAGEKRTSLIFRDISSRKENEQALREERIFTEAVLNSLPGLFYVLNKEGKVIRCNDRSTEVFGLSMEEIIDRPAVDFVHEDGKGKVPEEIQRVLEQGYSSFNLKLNTADEKAAVYHFNAEKLEQNNHTFIIGNGVDVTKQQELEEQLNLLLQEEQAQRKKAEADRDKLKEMFEEAPSPKCILEGPELRYVIANKACRQLVGGEDIIGERVIDVVPEVKEQGYIELLEEVFQTGKPYLGYGDPVEINKKKKDSKQKFIFNLLFAPLVDENGEVYGIFIEAMDFSEQISYQERLEKSLKEKETLLAEVHHRVKNNLAIVTSMMELQAMDTENTELQSSLRTAEQRIQTIATIHELLYSSDSLSHLNFGENIKQLISNLEEIYSSGKQISVEVQIEQVPLNINQAIPCALMINEVVINAFKHGFKLKQEGNIRVELYEDDGNVFIEIEDDGVGIPENVLVNSSSLGITLINLLKQQLGGVVNYSSQNGTQFKLEFEKSDVKGIGSNLTEN